MVAIKRNILKQNSELKHSKINIPCEQNILFVIGSLDIGGAEKQLYNLIKRLHGHYYQCSLFALQTDGPFFPIYKRMGVPVFSGGLKKGDISKAPWKLIEAEMKLLSTIRKLKPDILHAYLPLITFLGAISARVAGVPLIITSKRALATHQDRYFILKYLDRMANRLSHHVTVNSQAVWNHTMKRDGIDPSKLVLIYNGVDVDEFAEKETAYKSDIRKSLDIRENEKVVIVVANYIPYKGHSDFLKAAKLVCEKKTGVKFLLVGEDRGIQKHLEAESIQLGISPFVKFLGQRNDISELLLASDLSVLPSHEEGFSNVVLESMASALPMVATNVGGNAESILDGTTGWLVSPRKPKELATKILDLLNDPIKSKRWGQKGKERIKKHFSIEKTLKAHLSLYRS